MARLTVSVEDETVERLRTLAGGERKVGSYLDEVTTWLWTLRDESGGTPLRDYELRTSNEEIETLRSQVAAQEATVTQVAQMVEKLRRQLQAHEDSSDNDA